tara:strand:+ start:682 stop:798 length:117 start_codon:yes stop_codon:yes gene_type:complete
MPEFLIGFNGIDLLFVAATAVCCVYVAKAAVLEYKEQS